MDRLSVVIALGAVLAAAGTGCERDGDSAAPPPARFNAATTDPQNQRSLAELCTAQNPGPFSPPALAAGALPEVKGWQWINVWATWCVPCVEEIPLIMRWEKRLRSDGSPVSLVFVSADDNGQVVAAFRAEHTAMPDGPRLADPGDLGAWVKSLGLPSAVSIPIHVFVRPDGQVACARAGALSTADYPLIRRLIRSSGKSP